jgi:hypothetical protein
VHATFCSERITLNKFSYFSGGRSGVSINATNACMHRTKGNGFISEE